MEDDIKLETANPRHVIEIVIIPLTVTVTAMKPRGVAVNHAGLWSPRPGFESPRGYHFFLRREKSNIKPVN